MVLNCEKTDFIFVLRFFLSYRYVAALVAVLYLSYSFKINHLISLNGLFSYLFLKACLGTFHKFPFFGGYFLNFNLNNNIVYPHAFIMVFVTTFLFFFLKNLLYTNNYVCLKTHVEYFRLFFLTIVLGSVWSSQEVLWNGYWNWDVVEKSIMVFFLYCAYCGHFFFLKNVVLFFEYGVPKVFFFLFGVATKHEFSNSVHSFVLNATSTISFLYFVLSIALMRFVCKNYLFKKNNLPFHLLIFFFLNTTFVYYDIKQIFLFKYLYIYLIAKPALSIVLVPAALFDPKAALLLVFHFFFFTKNKKTAGVHAFFLVVYLYALFFMSFNFSMVRMDFVNYLFSSGATIKDYQLYSGFKEYSFSKVNFVKSNYFYIKFYIKFYEGVLYFYIPYNNNNYVVYCIFLPLNTFFIILFFLKKKCFYF